jgi:hypothetical protein
MNKRIKKKKSHPLLNPVAVAYIVATKINTQCPGFASDFKLTHRKLKRCLMYHYYILKHNRKSLSHLYYTEPTLNKRYYSPECLFDAICRSHRRYNGEHDHPVGGEHTMYTSTASGIQFAPRIHDGRIISIDLCKEEN